MKKQLICLLLLLPVAVMFIVYGVGGTINIVVDLQPDYLVVDYEDGEELTVENLGDKIKLYGRAYPLSGKTKLNWSVSANENGECVAEIHDDVMTINGEGRVIVTAAAAGGRLKKSFSAYLLLAGSRPRYIYAAVKGLEDGGVWGQFRVENQRLTPDTALPLTLKVVPSAASDNIVFDPLDTGCVFDAATRTLITSLPGKQKVAFRAGELESELSFEIIENGVNVRSYDDLLQCTNDSEKGEIVVMQVNLESRGNQDRPDTALFGREVNGKVVCDYQSFDSTYDVTYFKNINASTVDYSLKAGIVVKKDFYGNGHTLNAHELCFPTSSAAVENGFKPYPGASDPFAGPLAFVQAMGLTVYGQDNVAFMLAGGVTVRDTVFKNCNNVSDLTHLDYVGTTVEAAGDDITLLGCTLMNGRTVLRAFSCQNLLVKDCSLSFGREFVFKMGSNSFLRGVNGSYDQRAPIPKDAEGNVLSDSSAVVEDSYFSSSGMFCIGIDTHFAGSYLAGAIVDSFPYAYDLAATSFASRLTLKGKVVLDDFKPVTSLDSSTLIDGQTAGNTIFDMRAMMNKANETVKIYDKVNGEDYVHGGIALFGGGRNLSAVDISGLDGADKLRDVSFSLADSAFNDVNGPLLAKCAGEGPFTFYIETEYREFS